MVNQIPHESCYFGIQATVLLYVTLSLQRLITITQPRGSVPPPPPIPKNPNSKYLQGFPRFVACLAPRHGLRTRGLLYLLMCSFPEQVSTMFSNFQKLSLIIKDSGRTG